MAVVSGSIRKLTGDLFKLKWLVIIVILLVLLKMLSKKRKYRDQKKLRGKVVVITGASSGIGYATALDFAQRNAKVILACRDKTRGEEAAFQIQKTTKNNNIVFRTLDLASLRSVKQFCRTILTTELRLDVLVNNAGVMACPLSRTEDGLEMQMAVNYFGHFLLTILLLNLIKKSQGKIINITSYAHKMGRINFHDLNSTKSYNAWKAYYQSKLAVVLFTQELSRRLSDAKVTVNAVHPGMVATNLYRHTIFKLPGIWYIFSPIVWLMWKSAEEAASSVVYLAVSDSVADVTGKYFSNYKIQALEPHALDEGVAKKLWETSIELLGL